MARKLRTHDAKCCNCGKQWQITNRQPHAPQFCSQRCSNLWQYAHGRLASSSRAARIAKFGLEAVLSQEACLTYTFECEECGKTQTKRRRTPFPRFCNTTCSSRFTARAGRRPHYTDDAKKLASERMIKRLAHQPENIYSWSTIKGWYKGLYFRSSYEYHFLKWLEKSGVSLNDLSSDLKIPYQFNDCEHIYVPDFYLKNQAIVYEVKSNYAKTNDPKVAVKEKAAIQFLTPKNIAYKIVTENDFPIPPNNTRFLISQDPCVFLSTPTSPNDSWEQLFVEQTKFMKLLQHERNFPQFPVQLSSKDGQRVIKDVAHDCMHELFEAVHLLRNSKSHRKTDILEFNRDAFLEELADVLHYFIEICVLSGLTPQEMYVAFMKKGTVNFSRILSDY